MGYGHMMTRRAGLVAGLVVGLGATLGSGCGKKAYVRDTTPTLPEELDPMLVLFEEAPVEQTRAGRRPLVIFALSADDPAALEQVALVREAKAGFEDRDMMLIEVYEVGISRREGRPMSQASAVEWHERFRASTWPVEVVLVGKDGGVKRRSAGSAVMSELFEQIDQMPVRKREVYERARDGG